MQNVKLFNFRHNHFNTAKDLPPAEIYDKITLIRLWIILFCFQN